MKTLFVTDLDGTLLTKVYGFSRYSNVILYRLFEDVIFFTYASARSAVSAEHALSGLNVNAPVVLYNGGLIYKFATKEVLRSVLFDDGLKSYVLSVLNDGGIHPFIFGAKDCSERVAWNAGSETEGMCRYLRRRQGDKRFSAASGREELLDFHAFNFKCVGPKEQIEAVWNVLKYDSRLICIFHQETYHNDYWLEISPREATKANAVAFLKDYLHCDKAVCFGDTSNDSDMFDVCDEKYAVMNADSWLKEKATGVVGYCEEDGVAKWLARYSGFCAGF